MKKIVFLLSFFFVFFAITVKAQKIPNCNDPYLPGPTWKIEKTNPSTEIVIQSLKLVKIDGKEKISDTVQKIGVSACVLDYLIKHQELIPVDWKDKVIVFSGTLYKDSGGTITYRHLVFFNGSYDWGSSYVGDIPYCNNKYYINQ